MLLEYIVSLGRDVKLYPEFQEVLFDLLLQQKLELKQIGYRSGSEAIFYENSSNNDLIICNNELEIIPINILITY